MNATELQATLAVHAVLEQMIDQRLARQRELDLARWKAILFPLYATLGIEYDPKAKDIEDVLAPLLQGLTPLG